MGNNKNLFYIIIGVLTIPFLLQFAVAFLILFLVISTLNPISETVTCDYIKCRTNAVHIIGNSTQESFNKKDIELQRESDFLGFNQYHIRIKNSNDRFVFRSGYLSEKNAKRDFNIIKNNVHITVTKRNTIFIPCLCMFIYVILLVIGTIINRHNINQKNRTREQ